MRRSELKRLIREIVIEPEESNRYKDSIERFLKSEEAKNILASQEYPSVISQERITEHFKDLILDEDTSDVYKQNPAAVLRGIIDAYDEKVEIFYQNLGIEPEEYINNFLDIEDEEDEGDED